MNIISYSLFGYADVTPKNCFEFHAYLRGLMVNVRMNRLIFPGWSMFVALDKSTYNGEYKPIFDQMVQNNWIRITILEDNQPLCTKMLWRLLPLFEKRANGLPFYQRVLCRDLDSVCTYREAQAVKEWIDEEKTMHCITDSISHNIPLMGGMCGFHTEGFWERGGITKWEQIQTACANYDMNKKGADQKLLNEIIYPKICHSATEHFVKGMNWNKPEKDGRHYRIDEGYPIDIHPDLKASNHTCGHIGSAGFYELEMFKFLRQYDTHAEEYKRLEEEYSNIFYWANR